MSRAVTPVWLDPHAQAGALAALLARLGFAAWLLGHPAVAHPCVAVGGFAGGGTAFGYVYAGPDQDGVWRFWLVLPGCPDMEPGGPLWDVSRTAGMVGRALARAALAGPLPGSAEGQPGQPTVAAA